VHHELQHGEAPANLRKRNHEGNLSSGAGRLLFLHLSGIFFVEPFNEEVADMAALPNMANMMKQIQKMQERVAQVQEELEHKTAVGESGGGMVKVTSNGKQHLIGIHIEKEVVSPDDVTMLEDLVLAAANKALEESSRMAQEEMAKVTSGLLPNIPGLNLPGM
jgi:DNA-binding YbaB/EbfC family protein